MSRRVEGDTVVVPAGRCADPGLGRQLLSVGVEHADPVALAEPPRQLAHHQALQGIHADGGTDEGAVAVDRYMDLEMMVAAGDRIGWSIHRTADGAGEAEDALGGHGAAALADQVVVARRGLGAADGALGVGPDDAREAALGAQQVAQAGLGGDVTGLAGDQCGAELAELGGVAVEMEAQVLLHPQHVADQRGALHFRVVAAGQPHQGGDDGENQQQRAIGQPGGGGGGGRLVH